LFSPAVLYRNESCCKINADPKEWVWIIDLKQGEQDKKPTHGEIEGSHGSKQL
jgi:hypothetical protein